MGKKVEKPQEDLAPAYFVQYSALWCILLGFFVMLLSLGKTQVGPGTEGLGEVRDAFGSSGGIGLLPYAKNAFFGRSDGSASSFRIRESTVVEATPVDGYIRGMLWKKGLADVSMISVVESLSTTKVLLRIPVAFRGDEQLHPESVKLLKVLGEIFLSLRHFEFEVMAVCEDDPDVQTSQRHAMLRAAVVARFLSESSSLPLEDIQAVGYSDMRYIKAYGIEDVEGYVIISIEQGDV